MKILFQENKLLLVNWNTVFPGIVSAETSFSFDLKGGNYSREETNEREETIQGNTYACVQKVIKMHQSAIQYLLGGTWI